MEVSGSEFDSIGALMDGLTPLQAVFAFALPGITEMSENSHSHGNSPLTRRKLAASDASSRASCAIQIRSP